MLSPPSKPQLNVDTDIQARYYSTHRSASIASASSSISSTPSSDASAFTSPETAQWQHISLPIEIATPSRCGDGHCYATAARPLSPISSPHDSESTCQRTDQTTGTRNTLIRALTYSYNHCLRLRPCTQEAADFLMFNQQIALCLHQYRSVERDLNRPEDDALLNELGAVIKGVESHTNFIEDIRIFEEYVMSTTADEYNGFALRDIIKAFAGVIPDLKRLSSSAALGTTLANHASD